MNDNLLGLLLIGLIVLNFWVMGLVDTRNEKNHKTEKDCENCPNRDKGGCWDGSHVTGSMWPICPTAKKSKEK